MLTAEENRKYWIMCSDYSDECEDIPIPWKEDNTFDAMRKSKETKELEKFIRGED
jgi:hypothetical protein|tara:strand:- start:1943 stop:2107 length:165 start_codon:yes stop_codon:yes gene_type:complete